MSTTQHTGHYNLPTFGDNPNDRPSWRGDFTDAMTKIDNQMYANATNITTATAAANNANTAAQQAKESADNAAELAQTNKTGIAELDGYFSKLGVTSPQTAQNLMDTINGKAENTALTALQGTVSTLSGKVDGKADSSNVYTKSQADTTFTKQGGYSGTAQALNQQIGTNTSNIGKLQTRTETVESSLAELTELLNAVPKFGIWHGAGNTDANAATSFTIPKTNNAQTISNLQIIPVTAFENRDQALSLNTELWYVEVQASQFVVHLRYRNIGTHSWASGAQPAIYMQAAYILTPVKA